MLLREGIHMLALFPFWLYTDLTNTRAVGNTGLGSFLARPSQVRASWEKHRGLDPQLMLTGPTVFSPAAASWVAPAEEVIWPHLPKKISPQKVSPPCLTAATRHLLSRTNYANSRDEKEHEITQEKLKFSFRTQCSAVSLLEKMQLIFPQIQPSSPAWLSVA